MHAVLDLASCVSDLSIRLTPAAVRIWFAITLLVTLQGAYRPAAFAATAVHALNRVALEGARVITEVRVVEHVEQIETELQV